MKTIILPGYSLSNKDWAKDIQGYLVNEGMEVFVHNWDHWITEKSMSIPTERQKISQEVDDQKVNFIAKSVGTRVLGIMLDDIIHNVNKIILCGIPTAGKGKNAQKNYESYSHFNPANLLVLQNESDPFAAFDKIANFMKFINPEIIVRKMPRSDHNYPFPQEFAEFLS